jgi:opacity protein-like surface antigen
MNIYHITTLLFCASATVTQLHADDAAADRGLFLGTDLSYTFKDDSEIPNFPSSYRFNDGFRTDLSLGYRFENGLAAFAEVGYVHNGLANTVGSVDLHQIPILLNAGYELPCHDKLRPFVNVGAGPAISLLTVAEEMEADITAAFQAEVGIRYRVSPRCSVGAVYKYLTTGNLDFGGAEMNAVVTHSVGLSLAFDL